ncbi:hypothetical protein B0H14DRAFT_321130 [Mycena olivaceomarginata]|nr:hypothetical protein B0H14DRAFT_321130 [Mycena olivaceomarginata]
MVAPRPSESAEAARAAAQQAEFNEKKWVWVHDVKDGYLAGWVNKEEADFGRRRRYSTSRRGAGEVQESALRGGADVAIRAGWDGRVASVHVGGVQLR